MMLEIIQGAARDGHNIDVGDVRRHQQYQRGARIETIQAGLAQHQAGQRVGEVVHAAASSTLAGLRARKPGGTNRVSALGTISTRAGATPTCSPSTCK